MANKPRAKSSRRLSPDQRVSVIMEAARVVLANRGYEHFLPAEVANLCGISEGTIYRYFPTKRDLLIRVAEAWFDELLSDELEPSRPHAARDRLQYLIWRCLSIIRKEPALTRFVLMELRSDPGYKSMRTYQLNRRLTSEVTGALRSAIDSGAFQSDVPLNLLRDMVFGCIEHQTWAYLRGEGDFSIEDTANGIADVIYHGMVMQSDSQKIQQLTASIDRLTNVAHRLNAD